MPDDLLFLSCFLCSTCSLIDPTLPACDVLLRLTCDRGTASAESGEDA